MRRLVETVASEGGGTWELYRTDQEGQIVASEIKTAGRNIYERVMIAEEVRRLMNAAVAGELLPYTEIKDIRRKPSVFELRWTIGDSIVPERMWRLYFVRWASLGPLRRALRFAEKLPGRQGKKQQNQDIDLAWARHKAWPAPYGAR